MRTPLSCVREFLGVHRVAIVGVSRQDGDYSRAVFDEFRRCGYETIPVNPLAAGIAGITCHPAVSQIDPAPEAAILLTPDAQLLDATRDCIKSGVRNLWFRRDENASAVYRQSIAEAQAAKANVIAGECPIMFLPNTAWYHRAHAFVAKATGAYPA